MNRRQFLNHFVAAIAAAAVWGSPVLAAAEGFFWQDKKPNIVVIMMDTLRSDHLGVYGYSRDTSPRIDALAEKGTVYTTAYSVSNWTNPAIKSIFTGLPPQAVMRTAKYEEAIRMALPDEVTTFAELVQSRGYRTAALVDHPIINPEGNYNQGFEYYSLLCKEGGCNKGNYVKSDVDYVMDQFRQRLEEYRENPFLIYLHLIYPHSPYRAPAPFKGMFGLDDYDKPRRNHTKQLINAYDAEIRRTDDLVGRVEDALATGDFLDNTWIILTSDHGEAFWEHGFPDHGNAFYEEAIRVPLIVVPPAGKNNGPPRIALPVSNIDVFATVLEIAGAPVPEGTVGVSLASEDPSDSLDASRVLFSESPNSFDLEGRAVIRDNIKYVDFPNQPNYRHQLFNLLADPAEHRNIYTNGDQTASELRLLLAEHQERCEIERAWLAQKIVEPDEKTLESLRSLGYIH